MGGGTMYSTGRAVHYFCYVPIFTMAHLEARSYGLSTDVLLERRCGVGSVCDELLGPPSPFPLLSPHFTSYKQSTKEKYKQMF